MKIVKARVILLVLVLLAWYLLTYPFDSQELIAGAAVAVLVVLLPLPGVEILGDFRWTPKALAFGIAYIFYFLWQLLKANLDVAFRVLHPKLPIEPGVVRVETKLQTALGRLLLANSITLTPGTITMETDGPDVYVHWIKVEGVHDRERTRKIVEGFERYLEVICG